MLSNLLFGSVLTVLNLIIQVFAVTVLIRYFARRLQDTEVEMPMLGQSFDL